MVPLVDLLAPAPALRSSAIVDAFIEDREIVNKISIIENFFISVEILISNSL
jgi:hypothetical protein